uniref:DnaJ homolog subfamily B member 9 n=1 Tax=Neogobius melanostomus TaxID=47308 RepID=A0A8C6SPW1_9GOBI
MAATGLQEAKARNYYDALSVEPSATLNQIKKAFRSLALKYHPDKNKNAEAEESFREIAEAYKVLSSSENRKLYDRLGHKAFVKNTSGVSQEEQWPHFDDIFHFLTKICLGWTQISCGLFRMTLITTYFRVLTSLMCFQTVTTSLMKTIILNKINT